jgi:hypothetical protein
MRAPSTLGYEGRAVPDFRPNRLEEDVASPGHGRGSLPQVLTRTRKHPGGLFRPT